MALRLPREFVDEMVAHAREDLPNECCGIIAGKDGQAVKLFRARNAEASPYRYNLHPNDLFKIYRECDENGWDYLWLIYHSHVASEAYPSPTDIRLAPSAETHYVVVSLQDAASPVARAYRIKDGVATEEPIEIS